MDAQAAYKAIDELKLSKTDTRTLRVLISALTGEDEKKEVIDTLSIGVMRSSKCTTIVGNTIRSPHLNLLTIYSDGTFKRHNYAVNNTPSGRLAEIEEE